MARNVVAARYTKVRFAQFAVAIILLVVGFLVIYGHLPTGIFWPLVAGLVVPTLFNEPYFTAPRPALATAALQLASFFSSDHSKQRALWDTLLVTSAVVAASALTAILRQEKSTQLFYWIATRLGRAIVLGSIVSVTLILQVAKDDPKHATTTAVVILSLYGILFLDWTRLTLRPSRLAPKVANVSAAIGPNQILINSYGRLKVGTRVTVDGQAGMADGYVAEDLASGTGSQYRIVLDDHWRTVTDGTDTPCIVTVVAEEEQPPSGFAIEGSTESTIRLNPSRTLAVGETLEITDPSGPLLYQVAGLQLEAETWSGSAAIVPRARLVQVGAVDSAGMILARPSLPQPYQAVHSGADVTSTLSAAYMTIGTLKGTNVPVGIHKDWQANNGHLAVLGMSGMGKTTIAAKLAQIAGNDDKFVILDETSEYRTRLGFGVTLQPALDWNAAGVAVCEPAGEMPVKCKEIIREAMTAAQAEYATGSNPRRRYILLEEAHGWLPEWNFATKPNSDAVNESCRYILQARKFNITFIMVSQRTAVISKSAISQCENYIILRTLDQTSLEYVEGVVGVELRRVIPELAKYEAVCVGPLFNSDAPIIVSLDPAS